MMTERKLATIERITEIHPIPDADSIERAVVRGWNVVTKKGEYKPGDLVVYCEIDSLMPDRPEFEFLRPRGFRIKTIKLRNQVSQGIIFPTSILPENLQLQVQAGDVSVGEDVTEVLGVTKYEPPIPACLGGQVAGAFPSHSIKSDEERIQNLREIYPTYRRYTWTATEKLDGSSATFFIFEDKFGVASRNLELKETETNSFWKVARELDIEEKMRKYIEEYNLSALTLQGELVGEGIQKNKYKLRGQTVHFFRLFDPIKYSFFDINKAIEIIDEMGLKFVPIVEDVMQLPENFDDLITFADGRSVLYDTAREGIVFVANEGPGLERYQNRLSFKVISNKFILKHDA